MASLEPTTVAKVGADADPDPDEPDSEKTKLHTGITRSSPVTPALSGDSNDTPENTCHPLTVEHAHPLQAAVGSANELRTCAVIPESADGGSLVAPSKSDIDCAESLQTALPSIGVFLSKSCTIPLI